MLPRNHSNDHHQEKYCLLNDLSVMITSYTPVHGTQIRPFREGWASLLLVKSHPDAPLSGMTLPKVEAIQTQPNLLFLSFNKRGVE